MASARFFPCSRNLPRQLAEVLRARQRTDLRDVAIILPTQRLQQYIRLALAEALGACIPPLLFTLDAFAAWLYPPGKERTISNMDQKLILSFLIAEGNFRHLRPGMESEVARFFAELIDEAWGAELFGRLRELVQTDPFRSDRHLAQLLSQIEEIELLYTRYTSFLDRHALTDGHIAFHRRVAVTTAAPPLLSTLHKVYVVAYADATATQLKLMRYLRDAVPCEFWFHGDPPDRSSLASHHPLAVLHRLVAALELQESGIEGGAGEGHEANRDILLQMFGLPYSPERVCKAHLTIHEAPTVLTEIKGAIALTRELIRGGVAPEAITIAVPQGKLYARLVRSVVEEAKLPANNSLGIPFLETRSGQWIRLFLALALSDWRLADLLALFTNPNLGIWLRRLGFEGTLPATQNALLELARALDIPGGSANFLGQKTIQPAADLAQFFAHVHAVTSLLFAESGLRLDAWASRLWQVSEALQLDQFAFSERGKSYNIEVQAIEQFYECLQHLTRMGEILQRPITLRELETLLQQNLYTAEIRPAGEPFTGVQIMNLLEARSIPSTVLIILGNVEGSFPASPGREFLVPEPIRQILHLVTARKQEELQDQLFYRLVAGAPEVHLFYHRQRWEQPVVKSRYLQLLEMPQIKKNLPLVLKPATGRLFYGDFLAAQRKARLDAPFVEPFKELLRQSEARRDSRGGYPGPRDELFSKMAASVLEDLLFCPYKFLLTKLKLVQADLPEEEGGRLQTGYWVHNVFESFFTGLQDDPALPPQPAALRQPWARPIVEQDRAAALERLRQLARVLLPKFRVPLDDVYQMWYVGWPAWVEVEIERGDWQFHLEDFEYELSAARMNSIRIGGVEIEVSGRVDRIIRTNLGVGIIDYKAGLSAMNPKKVAQGVVAQLPLYILILRQDPSYGTPESWSGEYFRYINGERLLVEPPPAKYNIQQACENLLEHWEGRLARHLEQNLPLSPEETENKCRYCQFTGICRRTEPGYRTAPSWLMQRVEADGEDAGEA